MTLRLLHAGAHPDDDTHAIGGTLLLMGPAVEPTVVIATDGEAGLIGDPSLATPESLGEVRRREERAAMAALGHPDARLEWLGYPDGGLAGVDRGELVDRLTGLFADVGPHVVVTFGPDGITRHDDHITMHHATTDAFHRAREARELPPAARLYYVVLKQSRLDALWKALRAAGRSVDPDAPFTPRGIADDRVSVVVDCSSVAEAKEAALRRHGTQASLNSGSMPADIDLKVRAEECFVRAWPPLAPGEPVAPGLFEGLTTS